MILIDSCIWIDAIRKRHALPSFCEHLGQVQPEMMSTCGVIMTEVIPFLNNRQERALVREFLSALTFLSPPDDLVYWEQILDAHDRLRKYGLHQIGILDIMIMVLAKEHEVPVLSIDKHFFKAAKALGIEVWHPKDLLPHS